MIIFNIGNGWTDHSTEGPTPVLFYKEAFCVTKEHHESKYRVLRGHATITVTPTLKEATDYVDVAVAAEKKTREDKELRTVYNYGATKLLQKYNKYSIVYKHNTFKVYENNDKGASDYIASFVRASDAELFVKAAHREKSGG